MESIFLVKLHPRHRMVLRSTIRRPWGSPALGALAALPHESRKLMGSPAVLGEAPLKKIRKERKKFYLPL